MRASRRGRCTVTETSLYGGPASTAGADPPPARGEAARRAVGDAHRVRAVLGGDLRRGRHPGAARRRLRGQQRLRLRDDAAGRPSTSCCRWSARWSGPPSGRWSSPTCRSARTRSGRSRRWRRGAVHEGGRRARGQAGGRPRGRAAGRRADRGRHPGDGAPRLHPAERARARRLPGAGPRRRRPTSCCADARRAAGGRRLRGGAGDGAGASSPSGSPTSWRSRPSASAPGRTATRRCWSGRTWPGCGRGRCPGSSSATPTCAGCCAARSRTSPTRSGTGRVPRSGALVQLGHVSNRR